jgi:hypothetical protein
MFFSFGNCYEFRIIAIEVPKQFRRHYDPIIIFLLSSERNS